MEFASKVYEVADIDDFVEMSYAEGWTDGFPVLPPTERRVKAMLDYYGRDPSEIIGVIPSGEGVATVEKIAINAAMAGCKPEYLPILVAAVQAMLDPTFELTRVQSTTAGSAPLAIISGPIVKKLGFNHGEGLFGGSGHRPNATIGRAIRLILWNIGLGKPGLMCHATFGHPGRSSYLIAERPAEDGNPWTPVRVAAGLKAEDSAVSMFEAVSHLEIWSGAGAQTLDNALYVLKDSLTVLGRFQGATQKLLVVNPAAAKIFNDAGLGMEHFRDALLEQSKRPVRDLKRTAGVSKTFPRHWSRLADPEDDDAMVPCMVDAHHLQIVVAGGWAPPAQQCVIVDSLHGEMVTKKIDWSWD